MNKETFVKYFIKFSIGIMVAVVLMTIKGFYLTVFADGLFLAGAFMMGIAGLSFVSREGGYDMFGYSFYYVFKGRSGQYRDFKDYQEKNIVKRKENRYDFSLLITGAFLVVASLGLYYILVF